MRKTEIQQNLQELAENIDKENFIYTFLLSFGLSKTTITRLKKGDYNLSKNKGEVFHRRRIFFKEVDSNQLLTTIDALSKDDKILRHKPRFIVVTDYKTVLATDTRKHTNVDFKITALAEHVDFFLPLSGAEIYRVTNDDKADRDAAYKMGELYDLLVEENPEWLKEGSHQLNIFLARLLFCFFAEDTGIFEKKNLFTETLANNTKADGSDVKEFLSLLFDKLNTASGKGSFPNYFTDFPYVNGGLFKEKITNPNFSPKARRMLIESGELDWSEINPDIFGSMIQAVADPEERNNLGMHYTSVENILKVIKPLFLDALYEEFEKNRENPNALNRLLVRLGKIKFFDPACGSGNFLIITYKEVRNLEIQILKQLIDLQVSQTQVFFTEISLDQFYGIEIKDFAHEMAILSLWLAEHQMNQVFEEELMGLGQSKPLLPLKEAGEITHGNAARMDWEEACPKKEGDEIYVIGNPPYLGARVQDAQQKEEMDYVFRSYKKYRDLDYIAIWFYKGSRYIENCNAALAFVSTNSISQGQQVALLWDKILRDSIEISFAHHSFKWTNNAKGNAGVTVIIIGLRNVSTKPKFIFHENISKKASNINAYLLDAPNVLVSQRNTSISGFQKMNFGNMPNDGGGLILSEEEREKLLLNYPGSEKYIRLLIGSSEFIRGNKRYCLWIEEEDLEEVTKWDFIIDRIEKTKQHRLKSKDKGTNKLAERSHQFRDRNKASEAVVIIPRVSSERRRYIPMGFLNKDTIILDSAMALYDAEPWLFGVLHSKMHMVWVDAVGGKLKTDYRYSAGLCYNTFPFPEISEKQKHTINEYVFSILDERAKHSEKTMAWMYNPDTMPSGLKHAHKELDDAIERIYKPYGTFKSDEERLEHLFKLYEEMLKKETLFAKQKKKKKVK